MSTLNKSQSMTLGSFVNLLKILINDEGVTDFEFRNIVKKSMSILWDTSNDYD